MCRRRWLYDAQICSHMACSKRMNCKRHASSSDKRCGLLLLCSRSFVFLLRSRPLLQGKQVIDVILCTRAPPAYLCLLWPLAKPAVLVHVRGVCFYTHRHIKEHIQRNLRKGSQLMLPLSRTLSESQPVGFLAHTYLQVLCCSTLGSTAVATN